MTGRAAEPTVGGARPPRVVGNVRGAESGPTLICVAGLHGNEPAGPRALERIFESIESAELDLRGELVGLVGNRGALDRGVRYVDRDLNRLWEPGRVERLSGVLAAARDAGRPGRSSGAPAGAQVAEDVEMVELLAELRAAFDRARGPVHVIDLHTTSGGSPPFATIEDSLRNRRFALRFPLPVILGIEEELDGTMLSYLEDLGCRNVGLEGGRHEDPRSVDHLEAAAWVALAAAGLLCRGTADGRVDEARATLRRATRGLPHVLEVRYRHAVGPGDRFRMRPDWQSFQPVVRGVVVAEDSAGPVDAPESGRMLMPLYQSQGEDGFFIVREFRRFWLAVSAAARRLRLDRALPWLPGVRRHPGRPDTLVVDRRVARWYALEIFHLLGYRRVRERGPVLVMSRRD